MPVAGEGEADYAAVAVILVMIVVVIIAVVSCICTRLFVSGDCGDIETLDIDAVDGFGNKSELQMAEPPPTCPICLKRPEEHDLLIGLPDCGHLFHHRCIEPWLELRHTCPVCRQLSPVPTPTATPLAEVVLTRDA